MSNLHARVVEALREGALRYELMTSGGATTKRAEYFRALASELADKAIVPRESTDEIAATGLKVYGDQHPSMSDRDAFKLAYSAMLRASDEQ